MLNTPCTHIAHTHALKGLDVCAEPAECSSNLMFKCAVGEGACVPWEYYCDGHADCADASDEHGCKYSTSPSPSPSSPPHTTRRPHHHA